MIRDLLKRHQTCHETSSGDESPQHHKRPRTSNACTQCAHSKQRCDGKRPICERCLRKGRDCQWTQPQQTRHLPQATSLKEPNSAPVVSQTVPGGGTMDI